VVSIVTTVLIMTIALWALIGLAFYPSSEDLGIGQPTVSGGTLVHHSA